jgi:agmatine deiminase
VKVANGTGYSLDRVTLHSGRGSDQAVLKWKYLNGTLTPPATGLTSATIYFKMPLTPGIYNFRFFVNATDRKVATSATVTVP